MIGLQFSFNDQVGLDRKPRFGTFANKNIFFLLFCSLPKGISKFRVAEASNRNKRFTSEMGMLLKCEYLVSIFYRVAMWNIKSAGRLNTFAKIAET